MQMTETPMNKEHARQLYDELMESYREYEREQIEALKRELIDEYRPKVLEFVDSLDEFTAMEKRWIARKYGNNANYKKFLAGDVR